MSEDSYTMQDSISSVWIQSFSKDFCQVGKYMHLIFCSIVEHTELEIMVRKQMYNILGLYDECFCAFEQLTMISSTAVDSLTNAYECYKMNLCDLAIDTIMQTTKETVKTFEICKQFEANFHQESEVFKELEVISMKIKSLIEENTPKQKLKYHKILTLQKEKLRTHVQDQKYLNIPYTR